ncbi:MAG: Fur family transcriptional regulator [Clostridiales bacterium]|nr:Fur family transcriptional regulator [Clostridiales bacterium]
MENSDFRTFHEYMKKEEHSLTASMEDYMEMIYRLSMNTGFVRIHDLSEALNVKPPSSTKMVQKLSDLDLLKYEKYGFIMLREKGKQLGEELFNRHNLIETLLKLIGVSEKMILIETEKMEHTISGETTKCFEIFISFLNNNPDIANKYADFRANF